jgi:hypothetical protein
MIKDALKGSHFSSYQKVRKAAHAWLSLNQKHFS